MKSIISNIKKRLSTSQIIKNKIDSNTISLTLNNYNKKNCLSLELMKELKKTLQSIEKGIKICILDSEGDVFSSGHDLKELYQDNFIVETINTCTDIMKLIRDSEIVFLAEVNGLCTAAGFQLALSTDLIVASKKSRFMIPGSKIGLYASTPGVTLLENLPIKTAFEVMINCKQIEAEEGYKNGFINYIVDTSSAQKDLKKEKEILRNCTNRVAQSILSNVSNPGEIKSSILRKYWL